MSGVTPCTLNGISPGGRPERVALYSADLGLNAKTSVRANFSTPFHIGKLPLHHCRNRLVALQHFLNQPQPRLHNLRQRQLLHLRLPKLPWYEDQITRVGDQKKRRGDQNKRRGSQKFSILLLLNDNLPRSILTRGCTNSSLKCTPKMRQKSVGSFWNSVMPKFRSYLTQQTSFRRKSWRHTSR